MPTLRKLKAKPQPVARAVGEALFQLERENAIMADSNQRLTNKVNILRQQIENDELAKFQHGLALKDFETLPQEPETTKDVKDHFLGLKKSAETQIKIIDQRLSVRVPLLAELEQQLQAGTAPAA